MTAVDEVTQQLERTRQSYRAIFRELADLHIKKLRAEIDSLTAEIRRGGYPPRMTSATHCERGRLIAKVEQIEQLIKEAHAADERLKQAVTGGAL